MMWIVIAIVGMLLVCVCSVTLLRRRRGRA
jgi:hypothetical protein